MKLSMRSATTLRRSLSALMVSLCLVAVATPALADGRWHHGWGHHDRYDDDDYRGGVYVVAPPVAAYAPPGYYYRPAPPPPPVYYVPPPVYQPPLFNIVLPLHF